MKTPILVLAAWWSVRLAVGFSAGQGGDKTPQYEGDIAPIFQANCVRCHGDKRRKAELDLSSRAGVLKGSELGPVIVPGQVEKSKLFEMIHKGSMPPSKSDTFGAKEIETIKRWIAAGAPGLSDASSDAVTQLDIEPLMLLRCGVCHGLRRQEGGLDLRTRASMLRGGKSGPAIVLGKPAESLVLKKIHAGAMPPNKRLLEVSVKPMAKDEIARLTRWIEQGAPEVEAVPDVATTEPDPLVTDKDRDFWAFQAPGPVQVPVVVGQKGIRNPIDAFIVYKLREKGLSLAPEADRLTLLRRASFDLHGLPPEPEEVEVFLKDAAPDAYEKMIDRLLASPRYGERWGRYWLDLAGYADSEGKRSADPVRPHAWRYRDYVIRSFNMDKPYDRFLLEQLAGDELADYEHGPITAEIMDNLVATGFLRMTPDGTGSDVVNFVPDRLDVIADEMQVFGGGILGLTLHCARCHSHKYDPIPQRDYYRLLAVFKGAYDEHDWLKPTSVPGQAKSNRPSRVLSMVSPEAKKQWQDMLGRMQKEIDDLKKLPVQNERTQLIKTLESVVASEPGIHGLWDRGTPSPAFIYRRGDYLQPTRLVGPGVPSVLTDGKTPFVVTPPWPGAKQTGRRLALARWLIQPDHPLTARVMVNRLWKHHFGSGLVKTLDNFGHTGARPTHPELLDWLALQFHQPATSGAGRPWSIKALHRLIMTSATYRQSSALTPEQQKLDPDNQLLSRMPLRRMEAEVVYDTLLLVAGRLDETRYGPPDAVMVRKDGLVTARGTDKGWRRSIYVRQRRTQIPTLLETFDLPQMNPNCVERIDSTVASQALLLLNNGMVHELATAFADRIRKKYGDDFARQVEGVYWVALSRPPTAEERQLGVEALAQLSERWLREQEKTGSRDEARRRALETYCHTILNSAAFVYID